MTQTARVYGGSLYELAVEEQLEDRILEQLDEIRTIFRENPDYLGLLGELSLPKKERTDMIEAAFGSQAERYVVNFLKILCERNILNEFGGCTEEFTRRYNADHDIAEVTVRSAVALSEEQAEALRTRLEKSTGKTIHMTRKVQPSLIGGICVEMNGKRWDGSVSGRLTGISRKLDEIIV